MCDSDGDVELCHCVYCIYHMCVNLHCTYVEFAFTWQVMVSKVAIEIKYEYRMNFIRRKYRLVYWIANSNIYGGARYSQEHRARKRVTECRSFWILIANPLDNNWLNIRFECVVESIQSLCITHDDMTENKIHIFLVDKKWWNRCYHYRISAARFQCGSGVYLIYAYNAYLYFPFT